MGGWMGGSSGCAWKGGTGNLCKTAVDCITAPAAHVPQFGEAVCKTVYKRPTDLTLKGDVPICCNLLVANVLDEGDAFLSGV